MATGIKITLQSDLSLLLQCNNETRSDLAQSLREGYQRAESDVIEMVRGEYISTGKSICYNLESLSPADIFALTDMPMFADTTIDDDNRTRVYGPVWGFPDYMIRDYITELAHTGRTRLVMVADYGKEGMTFPCRWAGKDKALADRIAVRAYENCLNPEYVTESIPDYHGEPGDMIPLLVDIKQAEQSPVIRDLF